LNISKLEINSKVSFLASCFGCKLATFIRGVRFCNSHEVKSWLGVSYSNKCLGAKIYGALLLKKERSGGRTENLF